MKNIWKIIFMLFMVFNLSCEEDDEEPEIFQVEVLGKGMDCGDIYLIRFAENDEKRLQQFLRPEYSLFPVFYASNLKTEHKEKGLYLNVSVAKITDKEIPLCTAVGPGYGLVWITNSETISLVFPIIKIK